MASVGSKAPSAAGTNVNGATTHVAFIVTLYTKRRITRGTAHIAVSSMMKMDMTTFDHARLGENPNVHIAFCRVSAARLLAVDMLFDFRMCK